MSRRSHFGVGGCYDKDVGRFISEDPLWGNIRDPQSLNRFAYGRNNPYKFVDPTGKNPAIVVTAVYAFEMALEVTLEILGGGLLGATIGEIICDKFKNGNSSKYKEEEIPKSGGPPGGVIGGGGGAREYNQKGEPARDYDPDLHKNPDDTIVGPGHTHEWGPEGRSKWGRDYDPNNPSDRALKDAYEKAKKATEEDSSEPATNGSPEDGSGDGGQDPGLNP